LAANNLIVDAQSIPLAVILSAANRHNIIQLDALSDAIPHIRASEDARCASANRTRRPGLQL
jgi:hypothetical protein